MWRTHANQSLEQVHMYMHGISCIPLLYKWDLPAAYTWFTSFFFFDSLFDDLFSLSNPNPTTNRLINQKGVPFLSPCCSSSPMFSLSHSHTYILYESPSAYHVITTSKKFWLVRAFWCLKYVQLCHNHDHICKYANFFISTLTFS